MGQFRAEGENPLTGSERNRTIESTCFRPESNLENKDLNGKESWPHITIEEHNKMIREITISVERNSCMQDIFDGGKRSMDIDIYSDISSSVKKDKVFLNRS